MPVAGRLPSSSRTPWTLPSVQGHDPIEELRGLIQPHVGRPVEREEGEEMAGNLLALFRLMEGWREAALVGPGVPLAEADLSPEPRPRRKAGKKQKHG